MNLLKGSQSGQVGQRAREIFEIFTNKNLEI